MTYYRCPKCKELVRDDFTIDPNIRRFACCGYVFFVKDGLIINLPGTGNPPKKARAKVVSLGAR